VWRDFKR